MSMVEKMGKTVDEAIESALKELQAKIEDVEIEVIDEPSKGLLGILGTKQAKVVVRLKPPVEENVDEVIHDFLSDVLAEMGLNTEISIAEEDGSYFVNIEGDCLGLLIGKRGQTLEAVQYITNIVANRHSSRRVRVILDAEGYRKRREEVLQQLANRLAHRVEINGESIMLEPMTAHERKIIHTTLQDNPHVLTKSEGEEPNRKVVIQVKE